MRFWARAVLGILYLLHPATNTPGGNHQQTQPGQTSTLARHYREGEHLTYHMKAVNEDLHYEIQADGVVKKSATGGFEEDYTWSHFVMAGREIDLTKTSPGFVQPVTLDPETHPVMPNLAKVDPNLIGPITDWLNFYADLWLAIRSNKLNAEGDHLYIPNGIPASWADGTYVTLGQSSIDFDLTLEKVDRAGGYAVLLVKHVPPPESKVTKPAEWMNTPVADTPNNWVLVQKNNNGKVTAAIGKETFDVRIKTSLEDGRILSATLDNLVRTMERECDDASLKVCGEPRKHDIHRLIEVN